MDTSLKTLEIYTDPYNIYKISAKEKSQGKEPEGKNFLEIMQIQCSRPYELLDKMEFKILEKLFFLDLETKKQFSSVDERLTEQSENLQNFI